MRSSTRRRRTPAGIFPTRKATAWRPGQTEFPGTRAAGVSGRVHATHSGQGRASDPLLRLVQQQGPRHASQSGGARGLSRFSCQRKWDCPLRPRKGTATAGFCPQPLQPDLGHAHQARLRDRPVGLSAVWRHDEGDRLYRAAAWRADRADSAALRTMACLIPASAADRGLSRFAPAKMGLSPLTRRPPSRGNGSTWTSTRSRPPSNHRRPSPWGRSAPDVGFVPILRSDRPLVAPREPPCTLQTVFKGGGGEDGHGRPPLLPLD